MLSVGVLGEGHDVGGGVRGGVVVGRLLGLAVAGGVGGLVVVGHLLGLAFSKLLSSREREVCKKVLHCREEKEKFAKRLFCDLV